MKFLSSYQYKKGNGITNCAVSLTIEFQCSDGVGKHTIIMHSLSWNLQTFLQQQLLRKQ